MDKFINLIAYDGSEDKVEAEALNPMAKNNSIIEVTTDNGGGGDNGNWEFI